jgi:hypothetical protein
MILIRFQTVAHIRIEHRGKMRGGVPMRAASFHCLVRVRVLVPNTSINATRRTSRSTAESESEYRAATATDIDP